MNTPAAPANRTLYPVDPYSTALAAWFHQKGVTPAQLRRRPEVRVLANAAAILEAQAAALAKPAPDLIAEVRQENLAALQEWDAVLASAM
jgi:hypothetical protein